MTLSIAVVIPAYNAEKTIETTITSVLDQTELPQEVIVVDDGSQDGTVAVVEKFGSAIRLIRQANLGSAVARQTGTTEARSEYIAYVDSDDWWPLDKISTCRKVLAAEEVFFMLADLQRCKPLGGPGDYSPRNTSFFPWAHRYFTEDTLCSAVENLYRLEPSMALQLLLRGFPVFPSTMLIRRDVFQSVQGWDSRFRRCQDFDFGLRITRRYPMHFLDEVQAILGLHEGNTDEYAYLKKQTEGDIKVLLAHLDAELPTTAYHAQVARALSSKYCSLGYFYKKTHNYSSAAENYRKAVALPGRRFHAMSRYTLLSCLNLLIRYKPNE
ncbi:glycosyltransferase family 2 protein [Geomonas azotofigens]|uniref:glycosyltransferase family 2 protein n=1 Tax=Geomonas azotofigens TaxID=2843196 RepID=UPI001C101EE3|nr:glycosyltransferase family 2 protein [Geomonas azotofigens]MBU5613496.1 glycosyltransferase [Geomonas azotofigens]